MSSGFAAATAWNCFKAASFAPELASRSASARGSGACCGGTSRVRPRIAVEISIIGATGPSRGRSGPSASPGSSGQLPRAQPFSGGPRLTFRNVGAISTGIHILRAPGGCFWQRARACKTNNVGGFMNTWKGAALAAALLAAASAGAAFFPPAHAQTAPARAPRAMEIFGGRGSQIGVTVRDVDESDAKNNKLSAPTGVVIEEVSEESPAAKAGLKKGDIVLEFDGERVRSVRQFTRLVQETPAGRKSQTTLMRAGQRINVTVEPRAGNGFVVADGKKSALSASADDFSFEFPVPPTPPAAPSAPRSPVPPAFPDFDTFIWRTNNGLGITVGDLSQQLAEYFGTKDGVLVTSVADNSAAFKAGIKAGDVITSFNGSEVTSPSDLRGRIHALQDGAEFTVGLMRDKKPLTLKGKAERTRPRRTYRSVI